MSMFKAFSLAKLRSLISSGTATDKAALAATIGGGAMVPVSSATVLADTAPANPGTYPELTVYYVSDTGNGLEAGQELVWIPTNHATLPATKGWRLKMWKTATAL